MGQRAGVAGSKKRVKLSKKAGRPQVLVRCRPSQPGDPRTGARELDEDALTRCRRVLGEDPSTCVSAGPTTANPKSRGAGVAASGTAEKYRNRHGTQRTAVDDQSELVQSFQTLFRRVFKMACRRASRTERRRARKM
jgi:hypothetical protein